MTDNPAVADPVGPLILAISGPVGAGKTTLASALQRILGAETLQTRAVITERVAGPSKELGRRRLQELGDELDRSEAGHWVANAVASFSREMSAPLITIDAVRTEDQIAALRAAHQMLHVHLTAPLEVLRHRYAVSRQLADVELQSFSALRENRTEAKVDELGRIADLRLDTGNARPEKVAGRVAELAGRLLHAS